MGASQPASRTSVVDAPKPTLVERFRGSGLTDWRRLLRYIVSGSASAASLFGTLTLLVEVFTVRPVIASSVAFVAGLVVSYVLQKLWVFASTAAHAVALPKFLTVTAIGFLLNTIVMWAGTEVLDIHYLVAQFAALCIIPLNNYLLNSLWTFR